MNWTSAQQKVIDTRNKNLLVSAAAGSGKTAVLVERIIKMITEGEDPIDIDRLLVVTFTNAAAAQMRERIGKAIDKKLLAESDNEHLQRQLSLLHSAHITTIHSFCLNIIRNYFHMIDLDPSFKIAEESEITLLKSDVMSIVLERWYEDEREDFYGFIESYSRSKSDEPVEEMILQLYNFAMSSPWPKQWLFEKIKAFDIDTISDFNKATWMKELLKLIDTLLRDLISINEEAINLCNGSEGPKAYLNALLSDREILSELKESDTYEEYALALSNVTFARLSGKKEDGVSLDIKEEVKNLRNNVKKGIKDIIKHYFFQQPDEMLEDMQKVKSKMQVLFEITIDFMESFAKSKEEKNVIDFNDLEHFALNILIEDKEGNKVPSVAALELSELFEEIMIDEYQDSNMVQETILSSISRENVGKYNRFMVGDVKQSIYKFRLAMPEIFMDKYKRYILCDVNSSEEEANEVCINLDKNFRSRKNVLDFVNNIFEQIMTESVGDIKYDEKVFLKYGGLYDGATESIIPELILVTNQEKEAGDSWEASLKTSAQMEVKGAPNQDEDVEEDVAYTKKELEARAIAARIKEITHPETGLMLLDKESRQPRRASYKDVVILLRSMTGWSDIIVNTLMQEGVPAYADTGTGYFKTVEIITLINMLKIIDNPLQDIPFTGVMYSPLVGLSSEELAMVRVFNNNISMYMAAMLYKSEGNNEELRQKLGKFLSMLEDFRFMVKHIPIHELIMEILNKTGYYYYVIAMPGGDRRSANIDMLISLAVRFEKGSYSGLFHFIRYIEKLHKYDVDYGEAVTISEQDNTVRIMSIHKSKGLEFPVVIVAGLSKEFNTQDIRKKIVLHSEFGAGPEYVDVENRTKTPTLLKKAIQQKIRIENMGEELRVLYVAMTRAKEKLILSGYLKSEDEVKSKDFSLFSIIAAKSYMDLILPAIINRYGTRGSLMEESNNKFSDRIKVSLVYKDEIIMDEVRMQTFLTMDKEQLMHINPETVHDDKIREELESRFNYEYPFTGEEVLRVKMSVSELKKAGQNIDDDQSVILYSETYNNDNYENIDNKKNVINRKASYNKDDKNEGLSVVPDFIKGKDEAISKTNLGTLYHKVLELIDLDEALTKEDIINQLNKMVSENHIKNEDIGKLKLDYIYVFVQSNVVERMRSAQSKGLLHKERQFVIGIKANEIYKGISSDEIILVQGIIDAFFEENGELVIIDYKSDVVTNEIDLVKRYEVQLRYYKKALEQILKKRVKEMIIYSLYLGKEIRI